VFPKRVQNYINQIKVKKENIEQDEKLFKKQSPLTEKKQGRELTKALRRLATETAKRQTVEAQLCQKNIRMGSDFASTS